MSGAFTVLAVFLRLGLTSFGGPVAHLGYFRSEFVTRRAWLAEAEFADLVALCQFLPGPASSQTGFAIGLLRAGPLGGLAAWCGFTLPSAILLVLFAAGAGHIAASAIGAGLLHGLKLAAVAIVAQAVRGMARSLCPDRNTAAIAVCALLLVQAAPGSTGQIAAIAAGAIAGLMCSGTPSAVGVATRSPLSVPVSRSAGIACLLLFAALLMLPPLFAGPSMAVTVFDAFYRSGALVFGGGHVVLPMLRDAVVTPGWIAPGRFLAGYGAAQAVPGPLFTVAAYLGAILPGGAGGPGGAAFALVAIFLPGLLLVTGILPFWDALRTRPTAQAGLCGVNAAVVGLLGAALYDPVWTGAVFGPLDFALAVSGFVLLVAWRTPPLFVVALLAFGGAALGALQ